MNGREYRKMMNGWQQEEGMITNENKSMESNPRVVIWIKEYNRNQKYGIMFQHPKHTGFEIKTEQKRIKKNTKEV